MKRRLDADSKRRLEGNPLRILDSQNPELREIIANAPRCSPSISTPSRARTSMALCAAVKSIGIDYVVDPRLRARARLLQPHRVRMDHRRARLAGRGPAPAAATTASSRISAAIRRRPSASPWASSAWSSCWCRGRTCRRSARRDVFVVASGEQAAARALEIVEKLRNELPHRRFEVNLGGGKFKAQFQRADRSGAALALILVMTN